MSIGTIRIPARIRRCVALAAPGIALALPVPAHALDPGVHFDPGSPAGKEYAIPLAEGRAEGAGTSDQHGAANTPFGVGITPPGAGGTGGGRRGRSSGAGGGGGNGPRGAGNGASTSGRAGAAKARDLRARIAAAEEPGGTGTWTLGVGLAVLVSAGLLALLLRNRPEQRLG